MKSIIHHAKQAYIASYCVQFQHFEQPLMFIA